MEIWKVPDLLCLHLKRFINEQGSYSVIREKISSRIEFPIEGLDLREYVKGSFDSKCQCESRANYYFFLTLYFPHYIPTHTRSSRTFPLFIVFFVFFHALPDVRPVCGFGALGGPWWGALYGQGDGRGLGRMVLI